MSISETSEDIQEITISVLASQQVKVSPHVTHQGGQLSTNLFFGTVKRSPLVRMGGKPGEKTLGSDLSGNIITDDYCTIISCSDEGKQSSNVRQLFRCISAVIDVMLEPGKQQEWMGPYDDNFLTDISLENKQFRLLEDDRIVVDVNPQCDADSGYYSYVTMNATTFGQYFVSLMLHGFEGKSGDEGTHLSVSDRTVLTSIASGNITFDFAFPQSPRENLIGYYFTLSRYDVYSRRVYPCDLQHRDESITQTVYKGQKIVPVPDTYSSDCDVHWCSFGEPSHANDYSTSEYVFLDDFSHENVRLRKPTVQDRTCLQLSVVTLSRAAYMRAIPISVNVGGSYYDVTMCFPFAFKRYVVDDTRGGHYIVEYPPIVYDARRDTMVVCVSCYLKGQITTCKGKCFKCGSKEKTTVKSRTQRLHIHGPEHRVDASDMCISFSYYHSPKFVFGGSERYLMDDTYISVHHHQMGEAVDHVFVEGAWFIDKAIINHLYDLERGFADCSGTHSDIPASPFIRYIWNVLSYYVYAMNEYGSTSIPIRVDGLHHVTHLSPLTIRRGTILCSRMMMFEAFRSCEQFMKWYLGEVGIDYN